MCVTANPASIRGTRAFVYATELDDSPVHVCGYQNQARTLDGGNCMFLNFAGSNLELVRGPEHTRNFMRDMTVSLPELVISQGMRGGMFSNGSRSITVQKYGDYTVILAQGPGDILSALDEVEPSRRPARSSRLKEMVDFYMSWYPRDTFVLACFDGSVKPEHPITVSYTPRNARVLTIPGLDGHDGNVPLVGQPVYRDFRVAFAINGLPLAHRVQYTEGWIEEQPWAPSSVVGFVDNRRGPNGDYVVPIQAVQRGLTGRRLADKLVL